MTRTVHLVYPSGPAVSSPDAIGRNLAERLRARYAVAQYDWADVATARPGRDDVLVGHPHPVPGTVFRRSARLPGWKRVVALAPFTTDPRFVGFHDAVIDRCDLFLAITGTYWYRRAPRSPVSHWCPKLVHVDLAVDRRDFPRVKTAFAAPGGRRFLYIGNTAAPKNVGYLSAIARNMPETGFGWIGRGTRAIDGVTALGYQDFRTEEARRLVAGFDFLLTVGSGDANPTTILEAMAWGLVPVCTRQSGYEDVPGIVNVPLGDVEGAAGILRGLQSAPGEELERLRATNDAALERHYTWDRFAAQVVDAIESPRSPALGPVTRGHRTRLLLSALTGPVSPARRSTSLPVAAAVLRRLSRRRRLPAAGVDGPR
jgi:glycosyltransferase involved in cell wall biosynthesis